ncbi:MAG: DEAD/DEAH box helicase [Prolixibacteraceae bacterium]|nr:DEAD/DEAH box helicase [Prolixibacteraceae bacterium]
MKFEDYRISPEIKENLTTLGFRRPTDIQYKAITPILKGDDVLAIAQTGTGKTAAFAIPVIDIIHQQKRSSRSEFISCLVMVPTRELALQITEVFQTIGQHTRVKTACVFGGVDQDPQISKLKSGIDILIATPGRMFDLVSQGHIVLDQIQILVLDEADHMLALGFIKDIRQLIHRLPKNRQTLFFSATINPEIKDLAYSLVVNPIRIEISPKNPVAKNVTHSVAFIPMDDKRFFLERIIKENPDSKILVFVRTKVRAERVFKAMDRIEIKTLTIHSDKEQKDRLEVMKQFRSGEVKILIATDVSARGIDIADVDYVINYDLPDVAENYVHRVGRTGRGVKKGLAVSFCSPEEKPVLDEIETFLDQKINVVSIDKEDYSATIDFSSDNPHDWRALLHEEETTLKGVKKKKKK